MSTPTMPTDTQEAMDYRQRRAVMKLKKLRVENADLGDLTELWAAIDRLPE